MKDQQVLVRKIRKFNSSCFKDEDEIIAVEEPLEIQLEYSGKGFNESKVISVTMRTPGNDKELGIGFLFTEGIIKEAGEIQDVFQNEPDSIIVKLREEIIPDTEQSERNFFINASCGVCGKTSIENIITNSTFTETAECVNISSKLIYQLQEKLQQSQKLFNKTGGLHASALFDTDGELKLSYEDIGRHNALDKIIGSAFLEGFLPLNNTILVLSGRAGFELVQKANMAGIKIVAAIGAPSSLAVQLADRYQITLIGFLREKRFNIYSGANRVTIH